MFPVAWLDKEHRDDSSRFINANVVGSAVSGVPLKDELKRARERASGWLKPEQGWSALRRHRIDLQCESHLELFSAGGEKMSHHSLLHLLQLLCQSVRATNCFYF